MSEVRSVVRAGVRLACRYRPGAGPTIVFCPGYGSDMDGTKAVALDAWAAGAGRAMLRFDYAGCGLSEGRFADGTLDGWRDDALAAVAAFAPAGSLLIVGSSMGGWIALLMALALGERVAGLVGIAAAPDFTRWGYDPAEKETIRRDGCLWQPSPYGDDMLTTRAFFESGEANLLLRGPIAIDAPVRLLQGQRDADVPWRTALDLADALRSDDVQAVLVKDGDHRLSRPQDIALLVATVAALLET